MHCKPSQKRLPKGIKRDDSCPSCDEELKKNDCSKSPLPCGHHCKCSWESDQCCYCGKEFGEEE